MINSANEIDTEMIDENVESVDASGFDEPGYDDGSSDDGHANESDSDSGTDEAAAPYRTRIEDIVRPIVEAEGFKLYDLEAPYRSGRVLRVFIWKSSEAAGESGGARRGVILDECARVSKALEGLTALDDAIEGNYIQEVSSPGVNRKLSKLEHFQTAVGEWAKVVTLQGDVLSGPILEVVGDVISIEDHTEPPSASKMKPGAKVSKKKVKFEPVVRSVSFADVKRARIDFQF